MQSSHDIDPDFSSRQRMMAKRRLADRACAGSSVRRCSAEGDRKPLPGRFPGADLYESAAGSVRRRKERRAIELPDIQDALAAGEAASRDE